MKRISLSQGQFAKVDDEDFNVLSKYKWYAWMNPSTKSFYAMRNIVFLGKRTTIGMHRQLLDAPGIIDVDHKNHDTLDNRRNNIRLATRSQILANRTYYWKSKSRTRGVAWSNKEKKWISQISVKGKNIRLGCYDNISEAALVYKNANLKYFGEFGRITHA